MNSICKLHFVKTSILFVLLGLLVCYLATGIDGKSAGGLNRESKQFFGIANMYPGKKPGGPCPKCDVCPTPCPATTQSTTITMNINAGDCTGTASGAGNFGACTKTTGAPSGSLSVAFQTGSTAAQPYSTVFVGILVTCPNTKVTLKCQNIPSGISVITQAKIVSDGLSDVATVTVEETSSMQVIIQRQGNLASLPANVVCTWTSSP